MVFHLVHLTQVQAEGQHGNHMSSDLTVQLKALVEERNTDTSMSDMPDPERKLEIMNIDSIEYRGKKHILSLSLSLSRSHSLSLSLYIYVCMLFIK